MVKRKVLIVEDEEDILKFMRRMLELKGSQALCAPTGDEAWNIFLRERPEAVVIDLLLVGSSFDGVELLRKIKEANKDTLCVVFTRIEEEPSLNRIKELGVEKVYFKPPSIEELDEMVELLAQGARKEAKDG